MILTKPH